MECPTKLFYASRKDEYKNSKIENEFLESLAEGGFQVGKMAMLLFPEGKEIKSRDNAKALLETSKTLSSHKNIVLFEPAFNFEDLLVRIDVFVKNGNSIEIIEVKAKSYDSVNPSIEGVQKPIKNSMLPYIQDIAFQKYVVSMTFPHCSVKAYMMMPDKSVSAKTNGLNQCFRIKEQNGAKEIHSTASALQQVNANKKLLAKVPVDRYVDIVMNNALDFPGSENSFKYFLPMQVKRWAASRLSDIKIDTKIHQGCKSCEFRASKTDLLKSGYHECIGQHSGLDREEIDKGTILDIWRFRNSEKLLNKGLFKIEDAVDYIKPSPIRDGLSFSERQILQVGGIPSRVDRGGFYFDEELFKKEQSSWQYPYHMIDFETSAVALPFFEGMRPYEPVAFQFSHHVLDENGHVEHRNQFLKAEQGLFPNFDFVRSLKEALNSDNGTIFRWAAHENTILNQIKKQLLDDATGTQDKFELISFIESITNNSKRTMIDLNELALRCYFHPFTKARTSIKKILPAVFSTSKLLRSEYSKPLGSGNKSLNFPKNFVWMQNDKVDIFDPYERLLEYIRTETRQVSSKISKENLLIVDGGAASMAYIRLQFEDMQNERRQLIENSLLHYCELDTLAMAMIMKAWISWANTN